MFNARFAISESSFVLKDDRDEAFDDPGLLLSSSSTVFASFKELFSPETPIFTTFSSVNVWLSSVFIDSSRLSSENCFGFGQATSRDSDFHFR